MDDNYDFLMRIANHELYNPYHLSRRLMLVFSYLVDAIHVMQDEYGEISRWEFFKFYIWGTFVDVYHLYRLDNNAPKIVELWFG